MPTPNRSNQLSIYPCRDTLEEVEAEAVAKLPITNPNQMIALLRLQQNTVLKLLKAKLGPQA